MKTVSMADLKANLSGCMKASEQAPVVIMRNGKPAAVLMAVTDEDELERLLMAHSPRLQAILKAARDRIEAGKGIPEQEFWADLERSKENRKRKPRQMKPA